jgi:Four helix bundle sensory module for signal transduction
MSVQFPNGKSRSALFGGIGICVGLLLFAVISSYYNYEPPVPLADTYKNIVEKRKILSQMRTNLLKSVEMEKNAVMAQTDEESQVFADQSLAASAALEQNLKELNSLIDADPMQDEVNLVNEFNNCWTELRKLDQVILTLAVQNTNLKAASLSREKGAETMRRFEHALEDVMRPYLRTQNEGQVARLQCRAMTSILKIYNLHSFHIAEASDEKMDQIEMQMKADENKASKSLDELTGIVGEKSRQALLQAKTAFTEFMKVTATVIQLSRQNTNVKSLDLSLGRKHRVAAQCDAILATFQEAVQNRTFKATK